MDDFVMILTLGSFIFLPILSIYPIFILHQRKINRIKNLALNNPEMIEDVKLLEGEDFDCILKVKNHNSVTIASGSQAHKTYQLFNQLKNQSQKP